MMTKKRPSPSPPSSSGFAVLPLPPQSLPFLRRCSSAPVNHADIAPPPPPPPPPPPSPHGSPLLRLVSDPSSLLSYSSPNSGENHGSEFTGSESPASKRLKRMSERMKEMKHWLDEFIGESDQDCVTDKDDSENEELISHKNNGGLLETRAPGYGEETVTADREGEAINIKFNCPCGGLYHILLLGQDCYYKLV